MIINNLQLIFFRQIIIGNFFCLEIFLKSRIRREDGKPANVVNAYLLKKYSKLDNTTTKSKLSELNALYMPINVDELRANTALKQNPFYVTSSNIE